MLFNEPKLLKSARRAGAADDQARRFSALQRAEIAEMYLGLSPLATAQRGFSALQRAEIAEIRPARGDNRIVILVSVLFNEPKLLKWRGDWVV